MKINQSAHLRENPYILLTVFNRFTRAQFAMMLCSMAIVHEECSVLLHTVKVNFAVELSR